MNTEEPAESGESGATRSRSGPGTFFWVFLTLVVAGLLVYFSWLWMAKRAVDSAKETIIEIAEVFRPDLVVTTFNEWRELKVTASGGNILEVATAESSEHFTRTTNMAMFGRVLPLTTTISEITIPATYRFHIDLNEPWNIIPDGNRLLVRAPAVRPSLPVAFDTGGVQKKTTAGWVSWDTAGDMEALEKEITGKLAERAAQPETLAKVRDEGRIAVAQFVRKWLIDQEAWAEGKFDEIVVVFDGEIEGETPLSSVPPTLSLEFEEILP